MLPIHWATFDLALHSWAEADRTPVGPSRTTMHSSTPQPGDRVVLAEKPTITRWWDGL